MLRKGLLVALLTLVISIIFIVPALSAPTVIFDGRQLDFDVNPVIENNRTMVSLSLISQELGVDFSWNADKTIVTGVKDQTILVLTNDSHQATINNETFYLDTPVRTVNNKTIVPLRFICEAYGAEVSWEEETQTVRITSPDTTVSILKPVGKPPTFPGYVGSIKTHEYHLMNCPGTFQITPGDVVVFNSKDEAEAAGYERCNICNP